MRRNGLITRCQYPWGDFSPTHAINPWLGCSFNCSYCWARDIWWERFKGRLSEMWQVPQGFRWAVPLPFEDWDHILHRELPLLSKPAKVLLCSTTDPYISQEECRLTTRHILGHLQLEGVPTIILTKSALLPERDFDILKKMDAWFGVTMERHPLESDTWHYARGTTLYQAYKEGIKTFVSLEPWIPGVDAKSIVRDMASFVDHWIVGPLNYKGIDTNFYRENLPGLIEMLKKEAKSYYIKPDLMRYLEKV